MKADAASEKKARRAKQTGKANESQLSAASTYYHPLNPLPNEINHLATINFGCNIFYVSYDTIS